MTWLKMQSKVCLLVQIVALFELTVCLVAQQKNSASPPEIEVAGISVGKTTVGEAKKLWRGLKVETPFIDDERFSVEIGGCRLSISVEGKANDRSIIVFVDLARLPNKSGDCSILKIGKRLTLNSSEAELERRYPYLVRGISSSGPIFYSFINPSKCLVDGSGTLYSVDARVAQEGGLQFFVVEKSNASCRDYMASQ